MEIIIKIGNKLYVHLSIVYFDVALVLLRLRAPRVKNNMREPKKSRKPSFNSVVTPQMTLVSQPKDCGVFVFKDREVLN